MSPYPPAVPADTTPEAWRVQMRAMAALTPQQRLALWADLNESVLAMEDAAVRRQYPELDNLGVGLELVRRRHGEALAQACRDHLAAGVGASTGGSTPPMAREGSFVMPGGFNNILRRVVDDLEALLHEVDNSMGTH